ESVKSPRRATASRTPRSWRLPHSWRSSGDRLSKRAYAAESRAMTRCGVAAVIGAPNAGKSTLVNALVGQKVAIVSSKAQTTRARLLGIALEGETQIILVDTPGIFAPRRRLDRAMVSAAWEGTTAADVILLVVDPIKQRRHELE